MSLLKSLLPDGAHPWLEFIHTGLQIALIVLAAMLLRRLLHRFVTRIGTDNTLPLEWVVGSRRFATFLIGGGALLLVMDRLGVSGMVLWTAFTGFATVAAVAFFAAWSVLSNIFCSLLIYTTRPFGLHDHIELLESGDKPGLAGQVLDINLIYTTLKEPSTGEDGHLLRIPNSLFFQRAVRLKSFDIPARPSL